MTYGILPTGFNRKPLPVILAELEAAMITEFGPNVIQTPQSPLGQINGLMADAIGELWELAQDVYQSYDPDQAEGVRLDILARLRLIYRGTQDDEQLRQAVTNLGEARVDVQDVQRAVGGLPGVSFVKMYEDYEPGTVAVAIIGGDDSDIADTLRQYIVPGINTYGNYRVSSVASGACRSFSIVRPIDVSVALEVKVRSSTDGCPPPSTASIRQALLSGWPAARANGLNVTPFALRSIIERAFPGIELVEMSGAREGISLGPNQPVNIGFIEIASLSAEFLEVTYV